MKRASKLWLSLALALGVLSACSKDDVSPTPDPTPGLGSGQTISLDLEASVGDDLRAWGHELVPQAGRFTLGRTLVEGDLVDVHTAISNGTVFAAKTLKWKYTGGRLRLEGNDAKIDLPNEGSFTGDWYICGFIGGTLDATKGEVTATPQRNLKGFTSSPTDKALNLDLPYAFGWTKLEIRPVAGQTYKHGGVTGTLPVFKIQGAVVGYKLGNEQTTGQIKPIGLTVVSNAFSDTGIFTLKPSTPSDVTPGGLPKWTSTFSTTAYTFANLEPSHIAPLSRGTLTYYAWAMPATTPPATVNTELYIRGTRSPSPGSPIRIHFSDYTPSPVTGGLLTRGRVHNLSANAILPVDLPFEYVTERNVNVDGNGFVTDDLAQDKTTMGYFNWDDAVSKFTNINIDGVQYYLPSALELSTAIGAGAPRLLLTAFPANYSFTEKALLNDMEINTQAHYRVTNPYTAYGIRLAYGGNIYRSAYRYRFVLNASNPVQNHLEMAVIYLGPTFSGNLQTIVDFPDSDWEAKGIVKKFPLCGYYHTTTRLSTHVRGIYWSKTLAPSGALFLDLSSGQKIDPNAFSIREYLFPVRLFRKTL